MKVFVTGGTGYLGPHIVLALVNAGHQITVLSRDPGAAGALAELGAVVVEGDLEQCPLVAELLPGHEAVIHNAILWEDNDSETGVRDIEASSYLFGASARAGVEHVIYTSSTAVHRPFRAVMSEDDELTPVDDYAKAKVLAERALAEISVRTGMRASVVRAGPIVGAPALGGRAKPLRRFFEMASLARTGGDIAVGSGEGRQFIGAWDLAQIYVRLLEGEIAGTFTAVAHDFITWEWIAREMVAAFGGASRVVVGGPEAEFVPRFDVGKVEQELGLQFEAESAIRELVWYLTVA